MEENRKKALAAALGQIEKQFGKGSVMRLGEASENYDVEAVSTGSLGLDIALRVGGLPRGRVIEIYGNPETNTSGNAVKFYATVRLERRRIGALKNGEEVIGIVKRVKVVM